MNRYDTNNKSSYSNEYLIEKFNDAYVERDVVRWKSSNNCVPRDIMSDWYKLDLVGLCEVDETAIARRIDETEAMANYINYRKENGYSNEEKAEIWNEIGADAVDVFTGKRIFS